MLSSLTLTNHDISDSSLWMRKPKRPKNSPMTPRCMEQMVSVCARQIAHAQDWTLTANAGPIVLAYPNLRPGWDTIFADTVEKLGIPFIPEGVRRLSPSRAHGDFHD